MARTRAYRRHQYEKRKRRFRKVFERWEWISDDFITPFRLGFTANTPHPCSGHCCGNPRKWFGEQTRQELKAALKQEEETEDARVAQQEEAPVSKIGG